MPRMKDHDPDHIKDLVERCDGNVNQAAYEMGCHTATVQKALREGATTQKQEMQAFRAIERVKARQEAQAAQAAASAAQVEEAMAGSDQAAQLPFLLTQEMQVNKAPMVLDVPDEPAQMLVSVPAAKIDAFNKVAAVMGCELVAL